MSDEPKAPPSPRSAEGRRRAQLAKEAAARRADRDDRDRGDGAALLDDLHEAFGRYVIFPSPEAHDAVVLYVAATHAQTAWEHATRLVIKSPLKRCGKTRLQDVIAETSHRPLRTTNISVAALVRSIPEDDPPLLILDEADTIFGKKSDRAEGAEDLRGILNSGHSRGLPYIRWSMNQNRLDECPTFAMAVIGGIGDMPDTIEDRAVIVSMRRRAVGESVEQFRRRRSVPPLHALRDRLAVWVGGHLDELADAEPLLPVEDRAADTWEPPVAIADLAGADWPDRARRACTVLAGEQKDPDDSSAGERLLADLKGVFGSAEELTTAEIVDRLVQLEESPWATWHRGDRLSARALAYLLKPYGVSSTNLVQGGARPKGYKRAHLEDPWKRYVPDDGHETEDGVMSRSLRSGATSATAATNGQLPWSDQVADAVADAPERAATSSDQPIRTVRSGVADVAPRSAEPDRASGTCAICDTGIGPEAETCADCVIICEVCNTNEAVPLADICIGCTTAGGLNLDQLNDYDPGFYARDAAHGTLR